MTTKAGSADREGDVSGRRSDYRIITGANGRQVRTNAWNAAQALHDIVSNGLTFPVSITSICQPLEASANPEDNHRGSDRETRRMSPRNNRPKENGYWWDVVFAFVMGVGVGAMLALWVIG